MELAISRLLSRDKSVSRALYLRRNSAKLIGDQESRLGETTSVSLVSVAPERAKTVYVAAGASKHARSREIANPYR